MMISWPDLVSVYVRCIVLHEFILICVVLGLFMLIASKCMFSRMLLWLYKLILNPVNFLTVCYRSHQCEERYLKWAFIHPYIQPEAGLFSIAQNIFESPFAILPNLFCNPLQNCDLLLSLQLKKFFPWRYFRLNKLQHGPGPARPW
jgi:hypothetical protein